MFKIRCKVIGVFFKNRLFIFRECFFQQNIFLVALAIYYSIKAKKQLSDSKYNEYYTGNFEISENEKNIVYKLINSIFTLKLFILIILNPISWN